MFSVTLRRGNMFVLRRQRSAKGFPRTPTVPSYVDPGVTLIIMADGTVEVFSGPRVAAGDESPPLPPSWLESCIFPSVLLPSDGTAD